MLWSVNHQPPEKQHKMEKLMKLINKKSSSEETVQISLAGFRAITAILMDVLLKMRKGERRIDEYRALVTRRQELIRTRRAESHPTRRP